MARDLAAENEALRLELEGLRQRELSELREQLALAKDQAAHFRAEAERNAALGRRIHSEGQAEIQRLRAAMESTPIQNGRPTVELINARRG